MKLKKVIWFADYFELISTNADPMFRDLKSLRKYTEDVRAQPGTSIKIDLQEIQKLFDHNTTEASAAALNRSRKTGFLKSPGNDIDYDLCASESYKGDVSQQNLDHHVDLIYQSYVTGAIKSEQSDEAIAKFKQLIQSLKAKNILVLIVIPPYHPNFIKRLKAEHPVIYQAHLKWVAHAESLKDDSVVVENFFGGILQDDGSPRYWNDGSHFTCRSVITMLQNTLTK